MHYNKADKRVAQWEFKMPDLNLIRNQTEKFLKMLDETERERCWALLTYVITRDLRDIPAPLSHTEASAIEELSKLYKAIKLRDHTKEQLENGAAMSDCKHFFSIFRGNLEFRGHILDYAINRIENELKKSELDPEIQNKLQEERDFFIESKSFIDDIEASDLQKYRTQSSRASTASSLALFTSAVVGGAVGLGIAILIFGAFPPLALALMAAEGTFFGICGGVIATAPLIKATRKLYKEIRVKQLANRISKKIKMRAYKLNEDHGDAEHPALKFSKALSTKNFGFFGSRQEWMHEKPKKAEKEVVLPDKVELVPG